MSSCVNIIVCYKVRFQNERKFSLRGGLPVQLQFAFLHPSICLTDFISKGVS